MNRSEVMTLLKEVSDRFDAQLSPLVERKMIKKKQFEDMMAGCKDGARICVHLLQEKGILRVED